MLTSCQIIAQSSDKFIRIVGNASHTFVADGLKADISVSEVVGNEYRKVNSIPLEEVNNRFLETLKTIGIPENLLTVADPITQRRDGVNMRKYTLICKDKSKVQALQAVVLDGVRVNSVLYTFMPVDPMVEKQMALEAIEDAKQKAESLCKDIQMRVGKMLNIEDTSGGCCSEMQDSIDPTTTKTYTVNVTYALKSK